jgi:hypothetical protein
VRNATHGLVSLDHWRHRPGRNQFDNLLLQALKPRLGIFNCLPVFPKSEILSWVRKDQVRPPARMYLGPRPQAGIAAFMAEQ